jgi:short-subunit dehydrogenase
MFRDKVVWITGASSGIGEAVAYEFFRQGAKLILSSNEQEELARVKKACGAPQENVALLPIDLEDFDGMPAVVSQAWNHFGRVDIFINNAGIAQRSLAVETKMSVYVKLMNIDCLGHIALTQAILPKMIAQKSGRIFATISVAGCIGTPLRTGYCAAKHALRAYCEALRIEVWDKGIEVATIIPGYIRTKITEKALEGDGAQHGKIDPGNLNGLPTDQAAKIITKGIAKRKREILVGGKELRAIYFKRFMPDLTDKIFRKRGINVI